MVAFNEFEKSMNELLDNARKLNFRDQEELANQKASKAEMESIYKEQDEARQNVYEAFIDLHLKVSEITTDEEWTSITKALGKLFK